MSKRDAIPKTENCYLKWHNTMKAGVTANTTGATAADNASKGAHADLNTAIAASQTNARALAQRIKKSLGYTTMIGDQLGIEGAEDSVDMTQQKQVLTTNAKAVAVVKVGFNKMDAEGVPHLRDARWRCGIYPARQRNAFALCGQPAIADGGQTGDEKLQSRVLPGKSEIGQPTDAKTADTQLLSTKMRSKAIHMRDCSFLVNRVALIQKCVFWFLPLVSLLFIITVRADATFNVRGRVEYRFWVAGNIAEQETNSFSLTVIGSNSIIKAPGITTPEGKQVETYEHISTPTLSWFTTVFKEPPDDSLRNSDGLILDKKNNRFEKVYNAYVDLYTNAFPPVHLGLISPIWMAYASGNAMDNGNRDKIYPMAFMGPGWPDINGFQLKCEVQTSPEAPNLPERMVDYADTNVFEFVNGVQQKYLHQSPLPELYERGFTNETFEVLSWTNISTLHLPLHFRLTRYVPKISGENNRDLDVLLVYEGFGESFDANVNGQVKVPETAPKWSRVDDYRFNAEAGRPYIYTTKSGRILSFKELQELKPGGYAGEVLLGSNVIVFRCIVIGLMIIPLFFLFVWNYRKGRAKTN